MKKLFFLLLLSLSLNIVAGPAIMVGPSKTKWQKLKEKVTSHRAKTAYKVIGTLIILYIGIEYYVYHAENKEKARKLYKKLKDYDSIIGTYFGDKNDTKYIKYEANQNGFEHSFSWPPGSDYTRLELRNLAFDIDAYNNYHRYLIGGDRIKAKAYLTERNQLYKVSFSLPH